MSLFKTSSFAENTVKLRHDNRQESKVLDKKLSLMRNMHRQTTNNLGLDSKMIAKRLKDNLERSAQAEAKIGKIKSGMPVTASQHYKEEKYGVLQALKEVWNDDESTGKVLAFANEVTLPAAIHLLHANGYEIEKQVTDKLDDMRRSQMRLQRISKTSEMGRKKATESWRRSSLPDLTKTDLPAKKVSVSKNGSGLSSVVNTGSAGNFQPNSRKHLRHRHDSVSSSSTSSSVGIAKRKVQRMRSQTQPNIFAATRRRVQISQGAKEADNRPTSAPNQDGDVTNDLPKKFAVKASTVAWVENTSLSAHIPKHVEGSTPVLSANFSDNRGVEKINSRSQQESRVPDASAPNANAVTAISSDEEDIRVYGEDSNTEEPLRELHNKIHTRMEDVTLIDLHRASVATKNYPRRMKTFVREIKDYKVPEEEQGEGMNGDYYSYRMRQTATRAGTGRRVKSATRRGHCLVTSLPSSVSCCSSDCEDSSSEEEIITEQPGRSLVNCRNRSLTMKTLSTVWGPSEFIECVL